MEVAVCLSLAVEGRGARLAAEDALGRVQIAVAGGGEGRGEVWGCYRPISLLRQTVASQGCWWRGRPGGR